MGRRAERGAVGAILLAVMALTLVGLLGIYVLNRLLISTDERQQTVANLVAAQDALERHVATSGRLPCPANPALDDGLEVQASATTCTHGDGTLPWRTVGMKREDAYDAWGRKISYRVHTGAGGVGSLTQPSGASMVQCDTREATPVAGANGICRVSANIYERNTTPAQFVAGKGLSLTDMGTAYNDVAYVLVSHGSTGLGAYTVSGNRRELPSAASPERGHTVATGPFTIKAFSDVDTAATAADFFDDLVAYRRLEDMITRAGLAARDWPEGAVFDDATMMAAVGNTNTDTGRTSFTYMGNTFTRGGSTGGNISYGGSGTGIGVIGSDSNANLTRTEFIRVDFAQPESRLAVTLRALNRSTFGAIVVREQFAIRMYDSGGTLIGSEITRQACNATESFASFTADPPTVGRKLSFTSGGTYEIAQGDVITGATSAATATITSVVLESGSWGAGTATGRLILASQTGTFRAENLNVGANLDVATIAADSVGITFSAVEIQPLVISPDLLSLGISSQFLISEVAACGATGTCEGTLATSANRCLNPPLTASLSPTSVAVGVSSLLNFRITNTSDAAARTAMAFTVALPAGLVVANPPVAQWNCPAGGAFSTPPAGNMVASAGSDSISVSGVALDPDVAACDVRVRVASSTAATYRLGASSFVTANLRNEVADMQLAVTP